MTLDNNDKLEKKLTFGDAGRKKLMDGVRKMTMAVGSTMGAKGNTVLIESPNHTKGITVTKDGVTVAKAVRLIDPIENLAVSIMREGSEKTALEVGDATTATIVLSEAFIVAGTRAINDGKHNRAEVLRAMHAEAEHIINRLKHKSLSIDDQKLIDVAVISANNDDKVGRLIAGVYKEVGDDGIVMIENGATSETTYSVVNGLKIDRGYSSSLFINNQKRDECVHEDIEILVCDGEISNILQVQRILEYIIKNGKKLLIIAPMTTPAINTLAANVIKNGLNLVNVAPPNFGYRQHELMQDIAIAVGAKYFSEKTGDDLSLITPSDLGHAKRVTIDHGKTIIVQEDGLNADKIQQRVSELRDALEIADRKADKDFILERIASLNGGIGMISVGGNTSMEQKELYDRVDDAVCAVRSALDGGVLPGGGVALYNESLYYKGGCVIDDIFGSALKAPLIQMMNNAGVDYSEYYDGETDTVNDGYDMKNGKWGDMIEMGVIDPTKVITVALRNAISVATTILSTNAIVTIAREGDS